MLSEQISLYNLVSSLAVHCKHVWVREDKRARSEVPSEVWMRPFPRRGFHGTSACVGHSELVNLIIWVMWLYSLLTARPTLPANLKGLFILKQRHGKEQSRLKMMTHLCLFLIWRQDLTRSPGCPWIPFWLSLLSAGVTGIYHHDWHFVIFKKINLITLSYVCVCMLVCTHECDVHGGQWWKIPLKLELELVASHLIGVLWTELGPLL